MDGFWESKIHDVRNFFDVFSKSFLKHTREEQKNRFKRPKNAEEAILGLDSGGPNPPGERIREGYEILALQNELSLSDSPSVIDLGI